jgi:multiple sugar transport system substrate-binding protein
MPSGKREAETEAEETMTISNHPITRRTAMAGGAAALGAAVLGKPALAQSVVEIEYWQYTFDPRVRVMDDLIKQFQAANPNIRVKHVHFPYADYRTKLSAAIAGNQGPDIVQFYYGWLSDFQKADIIQPLPTDILPPAKIDAEFFPMVQAMKVNGAYFALPTAVRSLSVFYNTRLMKEAGLDPAKPPATLDAMLDAALKMTKRDASGNITQVGLGAGMDAQDHHWWREVLLRQFGGVPYTPDGRKIAYDSEAGHKAFAWYTDLYTKHKVTLRQFMDEPQAAFRAQKAGMIVDGNFRIGALERTRGLEWIVAPLPSHNGVRSNFGSYWVNGITKKVTGEKLTAAAKFLAFVTTPDAMQLWLKITGELPARAEAANVKENTESPIYGPFVAGLKEAVATVFVDEQGQRQGMMDALNRVLLENQSPADSLKVVAAAEQKLLDAFYKS